MDPYRYKFQQEVLPPIFDAEHTQKLQEFEWSVIQNNHFAPTTDSPSWTRAYNSLGLTNAEKRLFGTDNYRFFIRKILHLSGFHQKLDTQDFQVQDQSLESSYDPHSYLLRGGGLLWYTALMRAQIHTNALYICSKIAHQRDCQELELDDDNIFTYENYNQLLWNATLEVRISPIPQHSGKL
jgi:hypothetical protein